MALVVAAFAVMIAGLSVWGIIKPPALFALVRGVTGGPFMFTAVVVRILLAIALWLAAPAARHPTVFKVLAIVFLAAAAGLLLMGRDRIMTVIEWWERRSMSFQRAWLVLAIGFCAYLLWGVWPAL